MSSIDKLCIQGIRSFGPDDKDCGIVQFHSPLTLILGPNGTGKTTIIEALKYVTTGVFPPNGKKEAAFVHDPKVAHELSVKAQVRLKFNDVRGQMCNITRSLQAEQKAKSITMKTLEGIIEMHLANGGAQTISSRCAEIDKEMVGLLGVSRPVLENVIFVHQEESNWPLNEGKALKEKFDDIFASTRYVKALDSIVKVRKGYVDDIKVLKEGIKFYKANKDKAEQLQGDMEETEVKYLASKTTVENIEKNLKPIEDKLEKIGEKEREIFELHTKIETLKSERTEMTSTMKELKESVKQEYTGSTERLRREILEHDQKVQEQEDNVHQLNKELKRVDADLDKATRIKNQHIMENGKLQQQAAQHMEHIEQRSSLVKQHADHYELEGFYGEITDAHYRKFERAMDDKSSELQQQGLTVKDEFEAQEAAIQERIEKKSMLQTQIETELKLKTERLNNNKSELQSINRQLAKVSASRDLLATVMQNLSRVELECDNAETAVDLESLRGDIKNLQAEKKSLDAQYKEIDSELQKMHAQSTTRTQLEMLRKDKATKEDNIRKLKTKHEDCIQNALGHMPNTKLRRAIDEFISKQTAEVNQTQATIQDMRIKVSSLRTEKKTLRDQLTQKKEELRGHEEKIYEECENQDFDEGLRNLSQRIKKNQEKHGLLSGSETVFKNYKNKLSKDNPPCPLCSRRFDSQSDVEELIHELETKLAQIPTTANQVMTDIQRFQQKYDRMQQLKPIKTAIEKLKQEDIPHLNKKINEMEKTIEELSDQIEEKEQQLEMQQVDEAMAKSVQPDMVTVDRLETELRDIDNKIVIQETRMVGADPNRTVDMVTAERQRIQINIDKLGVELDSKQQQLTDHTDTIQRLKTSVNDLRARKLELDQQLQQRQKLEETKAQLTTDNKQLHEEIEDGRQQLKPLKLNINELTKEKETITKNKEQQYDQNREKVNCVREHWTEVRNIQAMINRYVEDGVEDELQQSNEKMEDLARKVENLEKRRDECQSQLNSTKDQLAKQQILKNDLNVNLAIRKKQQQINEKDDAIKENSLELGDLDVRTMSRDKRDLRLKLDSLVKEKHTASGRQAGLEEEMRRLKKEITSELYGKAAEQYRDHVIKLRTTELAITDLEKYHQALDSTIMNYHNTKMKEINNIIAELWRNTYKGNDIERIEIRSDQEEAASLSKSRRVYHYRVVMIKGDAALDMRGRCSAGQKVLASLIIRLALAETFCLNCGILALDEPTTNLDRHNIESLAAALVEIIKSRRSQKNFQLICITHDEEFVEMLGRSEFVDEFVRVKKNPLGLSKLVSTSVHELHSR